MRLADVAEIYDGPHATPKKTTTGPWFLSISSLVNGHLVLDESAHLSEDDFDRWTRRVTPREGDVLFSYETRLGEAALMPAGVRGCLGRRMGLLRPKKIHPRFLLYAYLGPAFQGEIEKRAIRGATVDRIPLNDLGSWPLHIPNLEIQKGIAEVLGALDDKIDFNVRTSSLVLELAVALYSEAVSESSTSVMLRDVGRWLSGGTPSTSNPSYWGGSWPWISAASLKSFFVSTSDRTLTEEGTQSGTRLVPPGAVLFVVRGMSLKSELRVGVAQREVAFGQDCKAILVHEHLPSTTVAVALLAARDAVLALVDEAGHGTGRLPTDRVERLQVRLPAAPSRARVEHALLELVRRGAAAEAETRRLTAMREVLLPALMSGELRVRDAQALAGGLT